MGLAIHFPPGRPGVAAPGRLSLCPDSRNAPQGLVLFHTADRVYSRALCILLSHFSIDPATEASKLEFTSSLQFHLCCLDLVH